MVRALLALLLAPLAQCVGISGPPISDRAALKQSVRRALPERGVAPVADALCSAVEQLEAEYVVPATPEFLLFGLGGCWSLSAFGEDEPLPGLQLDVEQRIEGDELRSVATFELQPDSPEGEPLCGELQVDASIISTTRADTIQLRTSSRRLVLPRSGTDPQQLSALLSVLHRRLSPEFRADEGVKVSLQTTYMDSDLHISRCLTRELAGFCSVHTRRGGDIGGESGGQSGGESGGESGSESGGR